MNTWQRQLDVALASARAGGRAIRSQFGRRLVDGYKGSNDVLLRADVAAQEVIVGRLQDAFPDSAVLAEEGARASWPDRELVWVVDPLDGSNNFGFGIAHCAISITLFHDESVVLALVVDPLLGREYVAASGCLSEGPPVREVPLERTTVSLVTNYSASGETWTAHARTVIGHHCRRVVSLWAPALDLALVADGSLDAMVCYEGDLRDTCGGLFLVAAAGGHVVDFKGQPFVPQGGPTIDTPASFIAARREVLADELLGLIETLPE
jgi:myo-inositol-1(or 4)-monophosphatase